VGEPEELRKAQMQDGILQKVRRWVAEQIPPTLHERRELPPEAKLYADIWQDLILNVDDIICRVTDPSVTTIPVMYRPCIPEDLQAQVMDTAHITGGHMAAQST
jgi:hypothetical protein